MFKVILVDSIGQISHSLLPFISAHNSAPANFESFIDGGFEVFHSMNKAAPRTDSQPGLFIANLPPVAWQEYMAISEDMQPMLNISRSSFVHNSASAETSAEILINWLRRRGDLVLQKNISRRKPLGVTWCFRYEKLHRYHALSTVGNVARSEPRNSPVAFLFCYD
jgi:hypothetical protein